MDLMQIRGFHKIGNESRMPGSSEDGKYLKWNNALGIFDYVTLQEQDDDLYVDSVTQIGDTVSISRSDGANWDIIIPDVTNLDLPGDTMVLFDEADSIGGRSNMTYDYDNQRLILTDSEGIFGKHSTFDSTVRNIVQYLGNGNLFINFGSTKTPSSAMEFNTAIGELALANVQGGDKNIAIGHYAGKDVASSSNNSIYIGPYAGRLNTEDDKLFIHNSDFTSLGDFQNHSLFYGEFDIGLLHINNRLDVSEEIQIGSFNVANTPVGGMVQFVPDSDPTYLKPQYYDNTAWVDFATGVNNYLTNVTRSATDWTFERYGLSDIVVPYTDTSYPSSGYQYRVQLSNGDDTFTHDDALNWDTQNVLTVDGAVKVKPHDFTSFTNDEGLLVNTGTHVYMYIDGEYRQLDNDSTSGEANHGENIGSSVEIYAGLNIANHNLQFYELKGNTKIDVLPANEFGNIIFNVDYTVEGDNAGTTGSNIYIDTTHTANASQLNFKKLYSSNGSVIITEYATYLDLTASAGGGTAGEVNSGVNIGGYKEVYAGKQGLNLEFRTLEDAQNITITQETNSLSFVVPELVQSANNVGSGSSIYKDYTETDHKRILNFRSIVGVDGVDVSVNGDDIEISVDSDIANYFTIEGVELPVVSNANKTLTWHMTYVDDPLTKIGHFDDIVTINLGSNLIYNPASNTLDAIGGSNDRLITVQNKNITVNPDGTVDRANSSKNVRFTNESGVYIEWDGDVSNANGLGWLAFENDYPIASDSKQGILQVSTDNGLTITNGVLDYTPQDVPSDKDAVLYYPAMYDLHDFDSNTQGNDDGGGISPSETKVVRRNRARASMGAAYVNGSNVEPFIALNLVIDSTGNYNDSTSWGNEDRGLVLSKNQIRSDWATTEIIKTKNSTPNELGEASKLAVRNGVMDLVVDPRDLAGDIGAFNFYMYDKNGAKIKVASLKGRYEDDGTGTEELVADLKIKGNIEFHCTDAEMAL